MRALRLNSPQQPGVMIGRHARGNRWAVLVRLGRHGHVVVHRVGMGQAVHKAPAMAEGQHGGRRHEAQHRESGERDGHAEADAGP
jgi:hypothetical protein